MSLLAINSAAARAHSMGAAGRSGLKRWLAPCMALFCIALYVAVPGAAAAEPLPRFTPLDKFAPHRESFECKHEADANPPFTPEADALFQQGLAVTSFDLWPDDRDYKKAAQLWTQAMRMGHWKAQFNLAGLYLKGWGVPQDTEKAIRLTEGLMEKGVPAAWDNMGTYFMGGIGVKKSATVAYAFWQKAADMGSMASQAYLGEKLDADYDDPPTFWGNRSIGRKMLECALMQGSPIGAFKLGVSLDAIDKNYSRALQVLHTGVKLGSDKAAKYLFGAFDDGDALVGGLKDTARAERYSVLGDALWRNPLLKFPNLDKVLPLPPAQLPKWDGEKKTLIDAAKAVVPATPPKPGTGGAPTRTAPGASLLATMRPRAAGTAHPPPAARQAAAAPAAPA